MRTVITETKILTFDELSEEAKERAVNDYAIDGLLHDWWEYVYEDAKNIGLEIESFDIDRRDITGKLTDGANQVMRNILAEHGVDCDTFKTVKACYGYKHRNPGKVGLADEMLLFPLLEDYLVMLASEYEYLTSAENVKEMSEANEWEYTISGKLA